MSISSATHTADIGKLDRLQGMAFRLVGEDDLRQPSPGDLIAVENLISPACPDRLLDLGLPEPIVAQGVGDDEMPAERDETLGDERLAAADAADDADHGFVHFEFLVGVPRRPALRHTFRGEPFSLFLCPLNLIFVQFASRHQFCLGTTPYPR